MAQADSCPTAGKMDDMASTLQIHLSEVRDIARTVTGVAGTIASYGFLLRIPAGSPAPDSTSLYLSRVVQRASLNLAYTADSAADELTRSIEALMAYTFEAATLARRTELAVMGLDVDDLEPSYAVSDPRANRRIDPDLPPRPALDASDHRNLSQAVLLSSGAAMANEPTGTAQLRAATATLHACAGRLRAAMSSGERPAAMLERFAVWLGEEFTAAVASRDEAIASWGKAYDAAREDAAQPARAYTRWLSAAAGGADQEPSGLQESGARARAAVREYSSLTLAPAVCGDHPRLGGGAG